MRIIPTDQAQPGMKLGAALYGAAGRVLLARGVSLTGRYIERVRALGHASIYLDDPDTAGIEPPEAVAPAFRAKVVGDLASAFKVVSGAGTIVRDRRGGAGEETRVVFGSGTDVNDQSIRNLADQAEGLIDQVISQNVLVGLNSIKSHDDYTFQHSIDVTIVGVLLARQAGWDRARVRAFAVGCLLHDIGKVFIDPQILNKNGPLTDEEFESIKTHPLLGYQVIKGLGSGLGSLVPQVAYQHHERQDGSGYPRGLRGGNRLGRHGAEEAADQIHAFGSLCAVSDVYDALTSDRSYRRGHTPDRVLTMLTKQAGTELNAEAVSLLRKVVAPFPVCAEVRVLNGAYAGYRGVVAAVKPTMIERPLVRLLFDPAGNRIEPREIDLAVEGDVAVEGTRGAEAQPAITSRPKPVVPARPLPPPVEETLRQMQLDPPPAPRRAVG